MFQSDTFAHMLLRPRGREEGNAPCISVLPPTLKLNFCSSLPSRLKWRPHFRNSSLPLSLVPPSPSLFPPSAVRDNYALSLMKIYRFCALAVRPLARFQMGPHSLTPLVQRRRRFLKSELRSGTQRNGVSESPLPFVILRPFADEKMQGLGVISLNLSLLIGLQSAQHVVP